MPTTRTPYKIILNTGNVTWSNMPAAATEFLGTVHRRLKVDLTDADKVRLVARVSTVGQAGATLKAEYSTDELAWNNLTANTIPLGSIATAATAWEAVPAGAKGDVFVRLLGAGGNGTLDPVFGNIMLEVR